jgi:hypothetical protein
MMANCHDQHIEQMFRLDRIQEGWLEEQDMKSINSTSYTSTTARPQRKGKVAHSYHEGTKHGGNLRTALRHHA